jgi:hypothetical protein
MVPRAVLSSLLDRVMLGYDVMHLWGLVQLLTGLSSTASDKSSEHSRFDI